MRSCIDEYVVVGRDGARCGDAEMRGEVLCFGGGAVPEGDVRAPFFGFKGEGFGCAAGAKDDEVFVLDVAEGVEAPFPVCVGASPAGVGARQGVNGADLRSFGRKGSEVREETLFEGGGDAETVKGKRFNEGEKCGKLAAFEGHLEVDGIGIDLRKEGVVNVVRGTLYDGVADEAVDFSVGVERGKAVGCEELREGNLPRDSDVDMWCGYDGSEDAREGA